MRPTTACSRFTCARPSARCPEPNPNGSHYSDGGIRWISYFSGGDALHQFSRPGYGYPQSLGCVEMTDASAHRVFQLTEYGTLVDTRS